MRASLLNRKLHRWGAILTAVPLLVVIVTGIMLQLKKNSAWVQPPTQRGSTEEPAGSFDDIIAAARKAEKAGIRSWDDVDRLDVRPSKGMVKVRAKNRWEVQIDLASGRILQESYRRSDLIESLHDGSFFNVKMTVFLPTAIILLMLWVTGLYLWLLPHLAMRKQRKKRQAEKNR